MTSDPQPIAFCRPHWDQLRNAIKARGLWDLVSTSGEQARERLAHPGPETLDSFDPLIAAHNLITNNALELLGPFTGCPVCAVLDKHAAECECTDDTPCPADYGQWIDMAADGVKQHVGELLSRESKH